MLAAFEASGLPEEDQEVDAVLSGVDVLVRMGSANPGRLSSSATPTAPTWSTGP